MYILVCGHILSLQRESFSLTVVLSLSRKCMHKLEILSKSESSNLWLRQHGVHDILLPSSFSLAFPLRSQSAMSVCLCSLSEPKNVRK